MGRIGRWIFRPEKIARTVVAGLILATCWILTPRGAFGDTASYHYDDAGRLTRVLKGTSGTIYHYDELGNLLSVTSSTTAAVPPILDSINPNVLFVGSTLLVSISGQHLLATDSVISNNPALTINNVFVTDSEITAEMTATASGPATITVNTPNGSANLELPSPIRF